MTGSASAFGTARALREAFDRSFAVAVQPASEAFEDLLAIRVAGEPYAIRSAQIAGLSADRKVVGLPSPVPELLGIVGFRGSLSPVYDLAALLGYPPGGAGRWILLAGKIEPVGLAFGELVGHVRTSGREVVGQDEAQAPRRHAQGLIRVGDAFHPVINLASVVEAIKQRVRSESPTQGAIIHEP